MAVHLPNALPDRTECPGCGSTNLDVLTRYSRAYLARCRSCRLAFAQKLPSDTDLNAAYDDYGHAWVDSPITRSRYREILESFEPYRVTNRILDFGCGAGFFLEEARASGWDVHGTEYSGYAISLAQGKGLDVRQGDLGDAGFPSEHFDVVTAFEVFEHLRDPLHQATGIARVTRPGGLLYGTTPNFDSLSRRLVGPRWNVIEYPEHLCYFTPRAIDVCLTKAGFRKQQIQTTGISVGRLRGSLRSNTSEAQPPAVADETLRDTIEGSKVLTAGKKLANVALSASALGDTLKVRFVRI